jgi:hypothetical protein
MPMRLQRSPKVVTDPGAQSPRTESAPEVDVVTCRKAHAAQPPYFEIARFAQFEQERIGPRPRIESFAQGEDCRSASQIGAIVARISSTGISR